ncbi:MAG: MBL fold metallo-hydrolase [Alphaproteobacteria bacterium]|nr:MBL fold metallo-hydrolase [Alphaproteobacteria bacterium]
MWTVELLSARQGDAILVTWGAPARRILIDGGPTGFDDTLRARLMALPEAERAFELLVITHVDDDHIGALLQLVTGDDPVPGLRFGDVWFNGYVHLDGGRVPENTRLEVLGPEQGDRLSRWLYETGQPWNQAFDRRAVGLGPDGVPSIDLGDGMVLQVLGPDRPSMDTMRDTWLDKVGEGAFVPETEPAGLELLGPPPVLEFREDLEDLAARKTPSDHGAANGSSIVLLARCEGASVLLSGDAHASTLQAAIRAVSPDVPLALDAFKLPHHGSRSNVTADLVRAVRCPIWVFSSDGTRFHHPDAEAVARVIVHSAVSPELVFNARSRENAPWGDQVERDVGGFRTRYPAPGAGSVVLTFGA